MAREKKSIEEREAAMGARIARVASDLKHLAVAAYSEDDEAGAARYRTWGKQVADLENGPTSNELDPQPASQG